MLAAAGGFCLVWVRGAPSRGSESHHHPGAWATRAPTQKPSKGHRPQNRLSGGTPITQYAGLAGRHKCLAKGLYCSVETQSYLVWVRHKVFTSLPPDACASLFRNRVVFSYERLLGSCIWIDRVSGQSLSSGGLEAYLLTVVRSGGWSSLWFGLHRFLWSPGSALPATEGFGGVVY